MNNIQLAFYNVIRRRNKAILISLLSAIAIAIFVIHTSLFYLSNQSVDIANDRMGADIVILPKQVDKDVSDLMFSGSPVIGFMDRNILEQIPMDNIESITPQFFLKTLADSGCCSANESYRVLGIDPSTDFIIKPWLEENNNLKLKTNQVVLGAYVMLEAEEIIKIMGHEFKIAGRLYPTQTGFDNTIFMNMQDSYPLVELFAEKESMNFLSGKDPESLISSVMIKVKPEASIHKTLRMIEDTGIDAQIVSIDKKSEEIKEKIRKLSRILLFFSSTTFLVSFIALFGIFFLMAGQRREEMKYLHSMGLTRKDIMFLFMIEVLIIIMVGGILGSVMGFFSSGFLFDAFNEILLLPRGAFAIKARLFPVLGGLIISLGIGIIISLVSMRQFIVPSKIQINKRGGQ